MNSTKQTIETAFSMKRKTAHKQRSFGNVKLTRRAEDVLHLKLFLRHLCPECSETTVAEEVRHLHHVRRVQAYPEQHEIEIWTGFPAEGLMREIVGVLRSFCCEMTACHAR